MRLGAVRDLPGRRSGSPAFPVCALRRLSLSCGGVSARMTEKGGPEDTPRVLPHWTGKVVFGNPRYDLEPLFVTVEAATVVVAAKRAVLRAKRKLARGTRVDR